jgi:hypothetical protein
MDAPQPKSRMRRSFDHAPGEPLTIDMHGEPGDDRPAPDS